MLVYKKTAIGLSAALLGGTLMTGTASAQFFPGPMPMPIYPPMPMPMPVYPPMPIPMPPMFGPGPLMGPLPTVGVGVMTAQELYKCQNGIGAPGGCFGPGNDLVRHGGNAYNDLTKGSGDNNDVTGRNGFLRRTLGF